MLTIDHLNLHLPDGYQGRADRIARLVAAELASSAWPCDRRLEHLTAAPVASAPGMTDRQLAQRIAASITSAARDGGGR